jgi:uncharacterized protein
MPGLRQFASGSAGSAKHTAIDESGLLGQIHAMQRQLVIDRLKGNKRSLQALGLAHLSLFGSTARGEAHGASDIDLAVTLDESAGIDLFRLAAISDEVARLLGAPIDMIIEPARNPRMQAQIDRDRLRVY